MLAMYIIIISPPGLQNDNRVAAGLAFKSSTRSQFWPYNKKKSSTAMALKSLFE